LKKRRPGTRPKLLRSRTEAHRRLTPKGSRVWSALPQSATPAAISAPMTKCVASTAASRRRQIRRARGLLHRPPRPRRWRWRETPPGRGRGREDLFTDTAATFTSPTVPRKTSRRGTHSCNIFRFSPTSIIDGGEAQHIRRGQSSPIRLVFWVELGLRHYMLWAPVDLVLRGIGSWYSKLGRIPLRTLTSGIRGLGAWKTSFVDHTTKD
jgi:hypothetical protein